MSYTTLMVSIITYVFLLGRKGLILFFMMGRKGLISSLLLAKKLNSFPPL